MKIKSRTLTISAIALLSTATFMLAQPVTYEFDGWCLSYEQEMLPEGSTDVTIPGAYPTFLVPSNLPTLSGMDNPTDTGLTVTFSKGSPLDWERRMAGVNYFKNGCSRIPVQFGLIQIIDQGDEPCRQANHFEYFEPSTDDGLDSPIELRCSTNPAVKACRVRDIYESGWEASIALPKTQFNHWSDAAADTRNFFNKIISDCGDN